MSGQLGAVLVSYVVLVGLLAVAAACGARCGRAVDAGAVVAQVLLTVRAGMDVAAVVRGSRPDDLVTHLGYIGVSVALLPLLLGQVAAGRGVADRGPSRARYAVLALACGVLVVVVLRQAETAAGSSG